MIDSLLAPAASETQNPKNVPPSPYSPSNTPNTTYPNTKLSSPEFPNTKRFISFQDDESEEDDFQSGFEKNFPKLPQNNPSSDKNTNYHHHDDIFKAKFDMNSNSDEDLMNDKQTNDEFYEDNFDGTDHSNHDRSWEISSIDDKEKYRNSVEQDWRMDFVPKQFC